MGLDQYLKRTTKKERAVYDHNRSLDAVYEERVDKIWNEKWKEILEKLPHDFNLWNIRWDEVTPEQQKQVDEYNAELEAIKKEIGVQKFDGEKCTCELQYWRKAWTIHNIIVDVLGWKKNDNCERMYLTKDNLKEIIKKLSATEKAEDEWDRWDPEDKNADIQSFEDAIQILEDDEEAEIFYYAWY